MENMNFLLTVYSIVWAAVFGYVFFMQRKQRRLERDIDSLKKSMDVKE